MDFLEGPHGLFNKNVRLLLSIQLYLTSLFFDCSEMWWLELDKMQNVLVLCLVQWKILMLGYVCVFQTNPYWKAQAPQLCHIRKFSRKHLSREAQNTSDSTKQPFPLTTQLAFTSGRKQTLRENSQWHVQHNRSFHNK